MTYLRERMQEDMQLRGLSKKTQQGYLPSAPACQILQEATRSDR